MDSNLQSSSSTKLGVLLLCGILAFGLSSCGQGNGSDTGFGFTSTGPQLPPQADVNDLTVFFRQEVEIAGLDIAVRFAGIQYDWRCPQDVVCGVAGAAVVRIELRGTGAPESHLLAVGPVLEGGEVVPTSVVYQGYEFQLLDLVPHPRTDADVDSSNYAVTFNVTRAAP